MTLDEIRRQIAEILSAPAHQLQEAISSQASTPEIISDEIYRQMQEVTPLQPSPSDSEIQQEYVRQAADAIRRSVRVDYQEHARREVLSPANLDPDQSWINVFENQLQACQPELTNVRVAIDASDFNTQISFRVFADWHGRTITWPCYFSPTVWDNHDARTTYLHEFLLSINRDMLQRQVEEERNLYDPAWRLEHMQSHPRGANQPDVSEMSSETFEMYQRQHDINRRRSRALQWVLGGDAVRRLWEDALQRDVARSNVFSDLSDTPATPEEYRRQTENEFLPDVDPSVDSDFDQSISYRDWARRELAQRTLQPKKSKHKVDSSPPPPPEPLKSRRINRSLMDE